MKKKEKNVLFVVILALFLMSTIYLYLANPRETITFDMNLKVSNYTGMNVDTDAIYFGGVGRGGTSKRDVTLNTSTPSLVIFSKSGKLANWVDVEWFDFLDGGKKVPVRAEVPQEASFGNYTGELKIKFYDLPFSFLAP